VRHSQALERPDAEEVELRARGKLFGCVGSANIDALGLEELTVRVLRRPEREELVDCRY
jgi:hypothetical protein